MGIARRLLLLVLATTFFLGCGAEQEEVVKAGAKAVTAGDTADFTSGRSSICDVHQAAMTTQRVELTYGMKRRYTAIDKARFKMFPHADEMYDTRACMGLPEDHAFVHVCAVCTAARSEWLRTNEMAKVRID